MVQEGDVFVDFLSNVAQRNFSSEDWVTNAHPPYRSRSLSCDLSHFAISPGSLPAAGLILNQMA